MTNRELKLEIRKITGRPVYELQETPAGDAEFWLLTSYIPDSAGTRVIYEADWLPTRESAQEALLAVVKIGEAARKEKGKDG